VCDAHIARVNISTRCKTFVHVFPRSRPTSRLVMSLSVRLIPTVTLQQTSKMSKTHCCGGMRGVIGSLASHAWPTITCLSLVSDIVLSMNVSEYSFQLLPWMLNAYSAKVALCSHTSAIVSLFNPHMLYVCRCLESFGPDQRL
jgi:hypothetical protein